MSLDPTICFICESPKPVVYRVRAEFTKDSIDYSMVVWLCKDCLKEIDQ